MIHASAYVLFYALIAAASPLVLTTTFVVVRSERPRTNGIAFLTGFLVGCTIACILGLAAGQAADTHLNSHEAVEHVISALIGIALVAFGFRARTKASQPVGHQSSRVEAILESLHHVRPAAAFSMAGLLGFGGPKRLLLTFLSMAAVNEAQIGAFGNLTLVAVFITIATIPVWVTVGIVILAGQRAAIILGRGESWLTTHAHELQVWLSLGFGTALIADGLLRLVL